MSGLTRRYLRIIFAMAVLGCLVATILVMRSHLLREDQHLTHSMSTVAWKVSETIFEAQRLEKDLLRFEYGEIDKSALELSAELFWSRIDVMRRTEVMDGTELYDELNWAEAYLVEHEGLIFGPAEELRPRLREMREDIRRWRQAFRHTWIGQRERNRELVIEAVAARTGGMQAMSEYLIAGCMIALALYMAMELALSHRAHERERRLRRAEEQANAAKSAFLANVSHEVRTPLNGVLGMAEELADSPLDDDQKKLVKVIRSSGELLLATINDVLDLSKIEAGRIELEEQPFDLRARLAECRELHLPAARARGLFLDLHIDDDLPEMVVGDMLRVSQVINNLVSNAIKFTEEGGVDIFVRALARSGGKWKLSVSVRDTGIGVSSNARDQIFRPFVQAEADTTRRYGGTGLGLTISRNICHLMDGDLTLASVPGRGSTFTATFELGYMSMRSDAADVARQQVGAAAADWTARVPRSRDRAAAADGGDSVALDLLSGTGRANSTRSDAQGRQADAETALSDRAAQPEEGQHGPSARAATAGCRILIVDDSQTNRFVLRRFLSGFDVAVQECGSGEEAVDLARSAGFDIIFMDVQMPGMDGEEATRRIRAHEEESGADQACIVAATANIMRHQIDGYLAAGMDTVLSKPVRKADFLDLMGRLGHKRVA